MSSLPNPSNNCKIIDTLFKITERADGWRNGCNHILITFNSWLEILSGFLETEENND